MMNYPQPLEDLINEFMKYPGIGRKTAERYALYTVNKFDIAAAHDFASTIIAAKEKIIQCPICGHLTETNPCSICADTNRNQTIILIVESPKDVFTIEKSGKYHGLYHVLNGNLSPLNGIGPEELNLKTLWSRVQNEIIKEVIIATSATQEGEATAMYIKRVLKDIDLVVSRIAYGVPVGANLEYTDDLTLNLAIENRHKF
ncbi:MAG: recombination mediator RecR [Candidatus Izemoplasmatales bacterium]|jgi:recombination protein RecR|nr:recombination mediator RecR [Candidatus Izemoplasmatales bacterium]MDD3865529.1 recombination mediator RecR [Candidatus Izemoplasmatales bacterium]